MAAGSRRRESFVELPGSGRESVILMSNARSAGGVPLAKWRKGDLPAMRYRDYSEGFQVPVAICDNLNGRLPGHDVPGHLTNCPRLLTWRRPAGVATDRRDFGRRFVPGAGDGSATQLDSVDALPHGWRRSGHGVSVDRK